MSIKKNRPGRLKFVAYLSLKDTKSRLKILQDTTFSGRQTAQNPLFLGISEQSHTILNSAYTLKRKASGHLTAKASCSSPSCQALRRRKAVRSLKTSPGAAANASPMVSSALDTATFLVTTKGLMARQSSIRSRRRSLCRSFACSSREKLPAKSHRS